MGADVPLSINMPKVIAVEKAICVFEFSNTSYYLSPNSTASVFNSFSMRATKPDSGGNLKEQIEILHIIFSFVRYKVGINWEYINMFAVPSMFFWY